MPEEDSSNSKWYFLIAIIVIVIIIILYRRHPKKIRNFFSKSKLESNSKAPPEWIKKSKNQK